MNLQKGEMNIQTIVMGLNVKFFHCLSSIMVVIYSKLQVKDACL